jgi:hypothetical protein
MGARAYVIHPAIGGALVLRDAERAGFDLQGQQADSGAGVGSESSASSGTTSSFGPSMPVRTAPPGGLASE